LITFDTLLLICPLRLPARLPLRLFVAVYCVTLRGYVTLTFATFVALIVTLIDFVVVFIYCCLRLFYVIDSFSLRLRFVTFCYVYVARLRICTLFALRCLRCRCYVVAFGLLQLYRCCSCVTFTLNCVARCTLRWLDYVVVVCLRVYMLFTFTFTTFTLLHFTFTRCCVAILPTLLRYV